MGAGGFRSGRQAARSSARAGGRSPMAADDTPPWEHLPDELWIGKQDGVRPRRAAADIAWRIRQVEHPRLAGLSAKVQAELIGVSPRTVKRYRKTIKES